jgi:hypothetical protein
MAIRTSPFPKFFAGFSITCAGFLSGCNIINAEEKVPGYVYVTGVDFQTDVSSQGTADQEFTEVWVSGGGKELGAFPLPAMIPVLGEGPTRITLAPGIRANGLSTERGFYPPSEAFSEEIVLEPGQIDTVTPTLTYSVSASFPVLEDFDGVGIELDDAFGSARLELISGSEAYALTSARITHDATHPDFKAFTRESFDTPSPDIAIFLELHYKCTVEFNVGVAYDDGQTFTEVPFLTLYPTTTWKKLYVNLASATGGLPQGTKLKLMFQSILPADQSSGTLHLDNLKAIY